MAVAQPGHQAARWSVLAGALSVQVAISTSATALAVLLPLVKAEFHLSFAEAGLLANFSFVGTFVTIVAAGWAVDRFGDRSILVAGGVITGLGAIACAYASSFAAILGALILLGVGVATPTPAGSAAIRASFPARMRGLVMSIRQTGVSLGGFLAALVLPPLAIAHDWRTALLVAGVGTVAMGLVCPLIYRTSDRSAATVNRPPRRTGQHVVTADLVIVGGSGILLLCGQFCLLSYLVVFLTSVWHQSITTAGLFLAVSQLAGAAGRVMWGAASDRVLGGSRKQAVMLAGGTAALGSCALGLLPVTTPASALMVIVIIFAAGASGWNGVQIALMSELAWPGTEGRTVATGIMIQQPGILLGPWVFGLIIDATNSFQVAWVVLAVALGAAVLLFSRVGEVIAMEPGA